METGHTNPTSLSLDQQEQLYQLTERAARSIGIDWGPYKSDTIWTDRGPLILEMAARVSGGWHSQRTTPLATGMNPIRAALRLCMGMPVDPEDFTQKWDRVAECRSIFFRPGKVVAIRGLDAAHNIPGVDMIHLSVGVGDTIKPYENCADRVCYVVAHGASRAEVNGIQQEVADMLKVETE